VNNKPWFNGECNKLLTGFDAPRAGYLYIDKELKEHNLLQAIARVNRLYLTFPVEPWFIIHRVTFLNR
jgi:hypothetical protein